MSSREYDGSDLSPAQTELATSLRIPFVTTSHPRWFYVTAVVISPDLYGGVVPTEDEVGVVASFNDQYREYWYRDSYKQTMRDFAPFDIDGGAVGRYLIKYAHGGWGFRKHTWTSGPMFVPSLRAEPASLIATLDRIHDLVPARWETWKCDHADVFAAVTA